MGSRRSQPDKAIMDADEDWTNVTDPTSRRRMQNRLAQRNYRPTGRIAGNTIRKRLDYLEQRLITQNNVDTVRPSQRSSPSLPAVDYGFPAMEEFSCDTVTASYFSTPPMFQQPFCSPMHSDGRQPLSSNNARSDFFQQGDPAAPFDHPEGNEMQYRTPGQDPRLYDPSTKVQEFLGDTSSIISSNRSWEMMDAMDTLSPATHPDTVNQADGNNMPRSPRTTHSDSSDMTFSSSKDHNPSPPTTATAQQEKQTQAVDKESSIPSPRKTSPDQPSQAPRPHSSPQPGPTLLASTDGMTTLHVATLKGHISILKILLSAGMDINARNAAGQTALHVAAQKGYVEAALLLLEKGARPDVLDERGRTPLHYAVEGGWEKVVAGLLEAGADATVVIGGGAV